MATGDITVFAQARLDCGKKIHDLSADVIKSGIVKSAANSGIDPTANTADPRWGAGGTTNLSSSQVSTTAGYTAPVTLTSVTWTLVSNVPTLRGTHPQIPQNASGFTNGRWAILYNDTATGKQALAFVDLGSDRSIVSGTLDVDFNGATNDIFTS